MHRRVFIVLLLLVAGACAAGWHLRAQTNGVLKGGSSGTNAVKMLSPGERRKMPDSERIQWLEKFGELPDGADEHEFALATKTSWWGKPLDPKKFWQGRVVWLDNSALIAAERHGRSYPPMPYEDPAMAKRSVKDDVGEPGPDGGPLPLHDNDQERGFWAKFYVSHPVPPEEIGREQMEVEDRILGADHWNSSAKIIAQAKEMIRTEPLKKANYPPEAFSEDVLFWTYVTNKKQEYQSLLDAGNAPKSPRVRVLLNHLEVATNYIMEPVPGEKIQIINGWRIAYLKRLQHENTDPSYIKAYLKAWNLPGDVITSGVARQPVK